MTYFFCPPTWADDAGGIGHANSTDAVSEWDYLNLVFDVGEGAGGERGWLTGRDGVLLMTAQTTLMLHRWSENLAAVVAYRQGEVDALFATRKEGDR
jgi:hypothetical protein